LIGAVDRRERFPGFVVDVLADEMCSLMNCTLMNCTLPSPISM